MPTLTGAEAPQTRSNSKQWGGMNTASRLLQAAGQHLPTLSATEGEKQRTSDAQMRRHTPNVSTMLVSAGKHLPTGTASDSDRASSTYGRGNLTLPGAIGGQPNPDWYDWYMGLPIGWTALGSLGT
jgi:hypothetical protein